MAGGGQISFLLGNTRDKRFNDRPEKKEKKNPVYEKRHGAAAAKSSMGSLLLGPPSVLLGLSGRYLSVL